MHWTSLVVTNTGPWFPEEKLSFSQSVSHDWDPKGSLLSEFFCKCWEAVLGVNTRWSYIESVSQVTALLKINLWKKNRYYYLHQEVAVVVAVVILNWRRYTGHHRPLDRTKSEKFLPRMSRDFLFLLTVTWWGIQQCQAVRSDILQLACPLKKH